MPIKFECKIFPAGNSFRITVPKPIMTQLKLRGGDKVLLWLNDGQIVAEKAHKK